MTTLRELLNDAPNWPMARERIEAWAYGSEEECLEDGCDRGVVYRPNGDVLYDPCPTCHGSGRTPGLVERVQDFRVEYEGRLLPVVWQTALRQELGEP